MKRLMENKMKYLELIQNVIERMAKNSFMLKGWSITVLAGYLALNNNNNIHIFLFIAIAINVMFWGLDSYYLQQERLYRCLYNEAITIPEEEISFSLDTTEFKFDLNNNFLYCLISPTEGLFYVPLIIINLISILWR